MEIMEDLRPRIAQLQELQGEDLKGAMDSLKRSLMENPAAVKLLMDEDIGSLVAALRRITGKAITEAATKPKKDKAKPMTAEELAQAFEEL